MKRVLLLLCLAFPMAIFLAGCGENTKLPLDTADYHIDAGGGCGCSGNAAAGKIAEKLQALGAFGAHPLRKTWEGKIEPADSTAALPYFSAARIKATGVISQMTIALQVGETEPKTTELAADKLTIVLDEGVDTPTVQFHWLPSKMDTDSIKAEEIKADDVYGYTDKYVDGVTLTMNRRQYYYDHILPMIRGQAAK